MPEHSAGEFGDFKLPPGIGKWVVVGVIVLVVIFAAGGIFGTVGAGQRGVLLHFGAVTETIYEEGLYYKIPFVQEVVLMSTQIQKYTAPATSSSKDLQVVTTEVTLNYQLADDQVGEIYRTMRRDYQSRVIQPFIQEVVKSTTANYDAEELITQRPLVKDALQLAMTERLRPLGVNVVELSITDFQFSPAFQDSIESKVRAVQEALAAQNALERVKFEAEQEIVRATAEARALELQKGQVTDQLLELRRIEVLQAAMEKWDGVMPSVVTSGPPIPMLNVLGGR